ncbi:MAG: HU family DNA-binding protein [Bacilli bacterium]|nr:HU family DNA-binding protein [Bacilli bacterium]
MNKAELVEAVAAKAKLSKADAEAALNAVICATEGALKKGDEVRLTGFGTFARKNRKARTGINPATRKPIKIPASKTVAFKVSKALKAKL